jgi:ElaB/YqjD/DUF883 family membrane-anchored ribosome-binding protein
MGINDTTLNDDGESAEESQDSGKCGFERAKGFIADKLQAAAGAFGEKAANQDEQSNMAQCEKQASEWLDQSAAYVRQFDYKRTDARLREHIRRNPGRSLLIAGGVGLIIGAMLRRR